MKLSHPDPRILEHKVCGISPLLTVYSCGFFGGVLAPRLHHSYLLTATIPKAEAMHAHKNTHKSQARTSKHELVPYPLPQKKSTASKERTKRICTSYLQDTLGLLIMVERSKASFGMSCPPINCSSRRSAWILETGPATPISCKTSISMGTPSAIHCARLNKTTTTMAWNRARPPRLRSSTLFVFTKRKK